MAALSLLLTPHVQGKPATGPVADAGLSRYAARDPIRLDGTGSYDPDGDPIVSYEWTQISGPEVVISDADTVTPEISGFFQTVLICPHVGTDCLRQTNGDLYPDLLPEPFVLVGPEDGASVVPEGVVLTCETSQHAVSYELLLGPDPTEMTTASPSTSTPPDVAVADFPTAPTYWTIRVRDAFGSTVFAPPRAIFTYEPTPPRPTLRRATPAP